MCSHNQKRLLAALAAMTVLLGAAGCAETGSDAGSSAETGTSSQAEEHSSAESSTEETGEAAPSVNTQAAALPEIDLSKWDTKTDWDDSAVTVTLDGSSITASASEGLQIAGSVLTITKGGTYVLSGTLDDGRVIVNLADSTEKVQLVLNGAQITSKSSAPLTVMQADKTVLTLAAGTENALTDAAEYTEFDEEAASEEESAFPNACIASKDDLTVNGSGSLTVTGNYNNGIHCKDDLKLVGGNVTVRAANHGVRGNDSVLIYDGTLDITSGGDGVKTSTADTDGKGYILMANGSVTVNAEQDGFDAAQALGITGGTLRITAGGGTANAAVHRDDMTGGGFGGRGGRGGWGGFGSDVQTDADDTASVSTKGLKAAGALTVSGGVIDIDAADDTVHSDTDAVIGGDAVLTLASGDDGVHADNSLTVADNAKMTVTQSYEGLEAYTIYVDGGETRITASDDGVNASDGGNSGENAGGFGGGMGQNTNGYLYLRGGYLFVNAGGDGLDSNGDIEMTGGTAVVAGPTNDGNGPLDCGDHQNTIKVTGGTLMAVGSTGMMEAPEANYIGSTELGAAAGTLIVVTDESGTVLGAFKTPKQAQGIVFSADGMSDGYYVYTGGTYDGTLNEDGFGTGGSYSGGTLLTSGSGGVTGGMGGFGGGMRGNGGGRGRRQNTDGEESFAMPEGGFPGMQDGDTPPEMPEGGFAGGERPGFPGGMNGDLTPPDGFGGNAAPAGGET